MKYLAGYPEHVLMQVRKLVEDGQLSELLLRKYPNLHTIRTDNSLYDYVQDLKSQYLRNASPIGKVTFDGKLQIVAQALGTHTTVSRVQGTKLKAKREIRIASLFKDGPIEFLRMIAVHELAHLKERDHNKAFYQLCTHIEPAYHQLEFDLRLYLTHLDAAGKPVWPSTYLPNG